MDSLCVDAVDKILKMVEVAVVKQEGTPGDPKDPHGSDDSSECLMKTTEGELRTHKATCRLGSGIHRADCLKICRLLSSCLRPSLFKVFNISPAAGEWMKEGLWLFEGTNVYLIKTQTVHDAGVYGGRREAYI